jgi:lysophospholipase L1-like esterase
MVCKRLFLFRAILIFFVAIAFAQNGRCQIQVINDGIPGQNSSEVQARLAASLRQFHPDFVVLFVGMNDAVNDLKFVAPNLTQANLLSIVHQIKANKATVILVGIHEPDYRRLMTRHPADAYGARPPARRIADVNSAIAIVTAREQVPFVDFGKILGDAGGATEALSTDGVHLNAKGYALLARSVRSALPQTLSHHSVVLCLGDSLTYGIGVRPAGSPSEGPYTYPAQLRMLLNP